LPIESASSGFQLSLSSQRRSRAIHHWMKATLGTLGVSFSP
jgi:hypothetical protein